MFDKSSLDYFKCLNNPELVIEKTQFSELASFQCFIIRVEHILNFLTPEEKMNFIHYVETVYNKRREVKPNAHILRFPDDPGRYVFNYFSLHLDKPLFKILSLGPKFCYPQSRTRKMDLEVQFGNLHAQLSDLYPSLELELERFKSTLVNCCYQHLNSKPQNEKILANEHLERMKSLKNNDNIVISRHDKGSGIMLLYKGDYIDTMNDETKFHKMENEKDKTVQIEKALSRLLREVKEQNAIDQITFERIRPIGTTIPRLYGLPKVHKANVPLRPILDMYNSPYHTVAKWLANTLEPMRHKIVKYSLKDIFEFVKSMDSLKSIHTKMFSLDVSSLFTSVPLEEMIDYLCNYIQVHNCNICLPPDALKRLLLFCTRNVQFKFNGEIYRQKDGVAMGSPLGPLFADIFMASLENTRLRPYIDNFHFYKRYVDDI